MSDLPKYLQRLDEALFDLPDAADGMLLSEVDGFLTGIALIPDAIPEKEWLSIVWRPNPETPDYLYHDKALLDEIAELVRQHLRMIAQDLHKGDLAPIYDVDPRHDETLWEIWIEGFSRAMSLRPEAFEGIEGADEEVQTAFAGLQILCLAAEQRDAAPEPSGDDDAQLDETTKSQDSGANLTISDEERAELTAEAPDAIPAFVQQLYDWSRAFRPTPDFAVPVRSQKVGRNDPCPCGSGKKYKKCCGAAA